LRDTYRLQVSAVSETIKFKQANTVTYTYFCVLINYCKMAMKDVVSDLLQMMKESLFITIWRTQEFITNKNHSTWSSLLKYEKLGSVHMNPAYTKIQHRFWPLSLIALSVHPVGMFDSCSAKCPAVPSAPLPGNV
jgi:hypothetical protein